MKVGTVSMLLVLHLGIDPKRKADGSYLLKYRLIVGGIFFLPSVLKEFPRVCSIEAVEK